MCLWGQVKLVWTLQWCQCIKNVWSEHLTLFYCCCCVVIHRDIKCVTEDWGGNIENKVGEIANQLKINSWELLAFMVLFPFPPPPASQYPLTSPRLGKIFSRYLTPGLYIIDLSTRFSWELLLAGIPYYTTQYYCRHPSRHFTFHCGLLLITSQCLCFCSVLFIFNTTGNSFNSFTEK